MGRKHSIAQRLKAMLFALSNLMAYREGRSVGLWQMSLECESRQRGEEGKLKDIEQQVSEQATGDQHRAQ